MGHITVQFTSEPLTYVGYAVDEAEDARRPTTKVQAALYVPEGRLCIEDVTEAYRWRPGQ